MGRQPFTIPEHPPVQLSLEATAENAAVARRAIAEEAIRAGLADRAAAAAQVVVTEGFTNAVRHAYPSGERGPVEVLARADEEGVTIVVSDHGAGFRPRPPDEDRWGGLGLELILTLAERVEICRGRRGGTEVWARVDAAGSWFEADGALH